MRLARLFGRKPFSTLRAEADRLFEDGQFGQAKLAYERAAEARDIPSEAKEGVGARVGECCDAIARARMLEAERLIESGARDLGEEELRHALETAWDGDLRRQVADRIEALHRSEVRTQVDAIGELDEEGRYLALGGAWEEEQQAEYDAYGERFRHALLQLHDGHVEVATREFEALLADAIEDAHYLWFEVGRARLTNGDRLGAFEALSTFLKRLSPSEGGEARLGSHMALAGIAAEHDDFEAAMDQYAQAIEAMPEDPRVYLAMGAFMRHQGLSDEATDVLTSGLSVVPENQTHFRLWQELGLAHADGGRSQEAIDWLERVVSLFVSQQQLDLPPEATVRLSQLHESEGNLARAADLLRLLCQGSDASNLFVYHLDAGRLLCDLGAREEAERMLARATELLPEREGAQEALDELRARVAALN